MEKIYNLGPVFHAECPKIRGMKIDQVVWMDSFPIYGKIN